MKKIIPLALLALVLAWALILPLGCKKPVDDKLDEGWSSAVSIASSMDSLGGWVSLRKYRHTLLGANPLQDGSAQLLLLDNAQGSWTKLPIAHVPAGFAWPYVAADSESQRILLANAYTENEQLVMEVLTGTISERAGLRDAIERAWIIDKKTLLGETSPNTTLNHLGHRYQPGLGRGILRDTEVYVPFCLRAQTLFNVNNVSNGPFATGVCLSSDSGATWQVEHVSDFESGAPAMGETKRHYYFFGIRYPINGNGPWASRKARSDNAWEQPKTLASSFANVYGRFGVACEGDTAHFCWMDRRHNKRRFNLSGPPIENNEIYYRYRVDSDHEWSKAMVLSRGLLYAYAPTISAEGDNVVVVWAGIQTADKQHTYMDANDIYFVTSKDGGKSWTNPLRVTDGAKVGLTSGMPQVALLDGTIHLLFTQGKPVAANGLTPGLTRLSGAPWPIYYTRRPFPE